MQGSTAKFEDILHLAGDLGRWQLLHLAWGLLIGIQSAMHSMNSIFIASVPEHHCAVPDGGEREDWLPIDEATGNFSQCYIRAAPGSNITLPCSSYVYQLEEGSSSVVSDWNLVCARRWMASTVQASYMLGACCGSLLCGVVSDEFGRKRALVLCGFIFMTASISAAFSKSYVMFLVLRLVSAATDTGLFNCFIVLYMEIIGADWRALMGTLCQMPYPIGLMILSGIAYLEHHWRHLQLAISLPALLMLTFWWFLPESPQWLIIQGRLDEALDVLKCAAGRNGRQLPADEELRKMMADFRASKVEEDEKNEESLLASCANGVCGIVDLVRTPKMRRYCLASLYSWLVCSMVFYGISFDIANLSSRPYLTIMIGGVAVVLALIATGQMMHRLGRRVVAVSSHLMSGITILSILAVPKSLAWPKLLLGSIGKFFSGATYGLIFVYTAEYLPTKLRTAGLGLASMFAMIGSMVAPYIVDLLNRVHWAIPSCVFGVAGVTAACVVLLLPETAGRRMPETVEDVEEDRW